MDSDRVAGEVKKAGGKVEETAGRLLGDEQMRGEGVVDQAKGAVQNAYGQVKDTARDIVDRAASEGRRYMEAGRDYLDEDWDLPNAREAFADGRSAMARYVQETPVAALLVAGAIGFGLALLLQRSSQAEPVRENESRRGRRTRHRR